MKFLSAFGADHEAVKVGQLGRHRAEQLAVAREDKDAVRAIGAHVDVARLIDGGAAVRGHERLVGGQLGPAGLDHETPVALPERRGRERRGGDLRERQGKLLGNERRGQREREGEEDAGGHRDEASDAWAGRKCRQAAGRRGVSQLEAAVVGRVYPRRGRHKACPTLPRPALPSRATQTDHCIIAASLACVP